MLNTMRVKGDIVAQMMSLGISRQEVAAAARMSERTLRTKLKAPERFTLEELVLIGKKLGLDIRIERRTA